MSHTVQRMTEKPNISLLPSFTSILYFLFSACRVVSLSYYLFVRRKENKVVNISDITFGVNRDHVYNI